MLPDCRAASPGPTTTRTSVPSRVLTGGLEVITLTSLEASDRTDAMLSAGWEYPLT